MRTIFILFLLFVFFGALKPAENLGVLKNILKPSIIDIHQDRLFVMDVELIKVYSLKDLNLIHTFGKKGEGPGEYKIVVNMPLRLQAHKNFLLVESIDKLSYFTLNGKYLREKRKFSFLGMITPIGKNYIGRRIIQPQDGSLSTASVNIYDQELKKIKELYRQEFIQQGAFPNLRLNLGKDFLHYRVADNKIFLEKSNKGFIIDVFDFRGKKLYEIKKKYEKIPITSQDKKLTIKDLEMDPHIQKQLKQFGFKWNEFSKNFKYNFPHYYPPIKTMDIDKGKIYITTFRTKENKVETIIMDFKGKVLKTTFIQPTAKEWVMAVLMGVRLETTHNGKIYYIQENEYEEWELFVQEIN